jgi:hypothetical protein
MYLGVRDEANRSFGACDDVDRFCTRCGAAAPAGDRGRGRCMASKMLAAAS